MLVAQGHLVEHCSVIVDLCAHVHEEPVRLQVVQLQLDLPQLVRYLQRVGLQLDDLLGAAEGVQHDPEAVHQEGRVLEQLEVVVHLQIVVEEGMGVGLVQCLALLLQTYVQQVLLRYLILYLAQVTLGGINILDGRNHRQAQEPILLEGNRQVALDEHEFHIIRVLLQQVGQQLVHQERYLIVNNLLLLGPTLLLLIVILPKLVGLLDEVLGKLLIEALVVGVVLY